MKRNLRTILILGLLFGLIFGKLTVRTHPVNYDGKLFYVGARLLATGGNPYDYGELQNGSRAWAAEGKPAGDRWQAQVHLPATLVCFLPFCWLPWGVFCWLLGLLNGFAVPLIAYLCLRYVQAEPDTKNLCIASALVAIFPATWQNAALGQIGLLATLFALLTAWALERKMYLAGGIFCLAALLKITCCLTLLIILFVRGNARQRSAIATAAGVWLALNAAGALVIGPQRFLSSYRAGIRDMFLAGGPNFPTSGYRVDMAALLAAFLHPPLLSVIQTLLTLLFAAFIYPPTFYRTRKNVNLEDIAALSLMALLLFYHQAYDAALLLPALMLGFTLYRAGKPQPIDWTLIGLLVLCLLSLGNHNALNLALKPLHWEQPYYFRTALFVTIYLVLVVRMWKSHLLQPVSSERAASRRAAD